nr:Uncharacterised protein [Raoultella sp. NCTC 9187]
MILIFAMFMFSLTMSISSGQSIWSLYHQGRAMDFEKRSHLSQVRQ